MKITFIQPYYSNIWEAIGLGYIISHIKAEYPFNLDINFFQGKFDSDQTIIDGSRDSDIVAFSCTSPAFPHALRLSRILKKLNKKTHHVFGGWHPSAMQERCLCPEIDQIIVGEGEKAFLQILWGDRTPIIRGTKLGWDQLPWPDRTIIRNERTVDLCESINGKRITSFQSNRVCPVSCVMCSEHIVTGKYNKKTNPIRSRPPGDVCEEIAQVAQDFDLNYFKFVDATFDVNPEYVINFCKEKISRELTIPWEALIHATFTTEEMFYWLAESNCSQIDVGVESGSPRILRDIRKGTSTPVIEQTFSWAKYYGIRRRAFFILGMPNETDEDIQLTEDLIDALEPDVVGFTILCPYPGCALYNAEQFSAIDWESTDEYSNDFWKTTHHTNTQLKEHQARLTEKYSHLLCERQRTSE